MCTHANFLISVYRVLAAFSVLSLVLQPFFQKLNDEIGEYYTEADMLTPSIYIPPNMTTDAALRKQFILATVREAVRIRDNIKNKTVSVQSLHAVALVPTV